MPASEFSAPHLFSENRKLATCTSNSISASPSISFGLARVSPDSIRALSLWCRNMFMRQSAHVVPFISWP